MPEVGLEQAMLAEQVGILFCRASQAGQGGKAFIRLTELTGSRTF